MKYKEMQRNILSLLLILPILAHAQLVELQNATITIINGTEVHINGDLHTTGNALIGNEGSLFLSGDLDHDATGTCFGAQSGTVILNGAVQSIDGSSMPVFDHLTLSGTGTKQLLRDVWIGGSYLGPQGVLQMNDRRLELNGNTLTILNGDANAIQRTTGFIVSETDPLTGYGHLRWNIGQQAVAGNVFVFPFGNADTDEYLPFIATVNDPGLGINGWLSMATYPTDPAQTPNNRPLPAGLTTLTGPANTENAPFCLDRWWIMETGGYVQAPIADLEFHYRESEWNSGTNMIAEAALMLQDRYNGLWEYPTSSVLIGSNRLNSTARPLRDSEWTASSMLSPLPIELLAFEGERISPEEVRLKWTTASERNNSGFEIWRMLEGGRAPEMVGWIYGAGDSNTTLHYEFIDQNNSHTVSYYFLEQVDHDGTATESQMIAIVGFSGGNEIILYPNPANTWFSLRSERDIQNVRLMDAQGQHVREWSSRDNHDVSDLPAGVYTVQCLFVDGSMIAQRLVVE